MPRAGSRAPSTGATRYEEPADNYLSMVPFAAAVHVAALTDWLVSPPENHRVSRFTAPVK